jgi:hypothetical protein
MTHIPSLTETKKKESLSSMEVGVLQKHVACKQNQHNPDNRVLAAMLVGHHEILDEASYHFDFADNRNDGPSRRSSGKRCGAGSNTYDSARPGHQTLV